MNLIRLNLEGTANTRDIGGYVANNNKGFKWKKVLRSDCMSRLTDRDKDYLVNKYNLKTIIDLRSPKELEDTPNAMAKDSRIKYINISLADIDPNKIEKISDMNENFLINLYIDIIENKKVRLKQVIDEVIDTVNSGSVLFHCTAGKDRTGVISMLLMGITGVSKQDITTNYMQTSTNLKYNEAHCSKLKKMAEHYLNTIGNDITKYFIGSSEDYIEYAYDKLIEKYHTFENYFLHIGITEDRIQYFIDNVTENL